MRHTLPAGLVAAVAVTVMAAAVVAAPAAMADPNAADRSESQIGLVRQAVGDAYAVAFAAPSFFTVIPTPTPGPATPKPTAKPKPKATYADTVANARIYARNRLGATQYACLDKIFTYESKWNPLAKNPRSGAYGIPQALPGDKMAAFGSNWRTSPLTQVKWGIWYVNERYGSACAAWDFILENGWY